MGQNCAFHDLVICNLTNQARPPNPREICEILMENIENTTNPIRPALMVVSRFLRVVSINRANEGQYLFGCNTG